MSAIAAKSSFGFIIAGNKYGELVDRAMTKNDFPIENSYTFNHSNKRSVIQLTC